MANALNFNIKLKQLTEEQYTVSVEKEQMFHCIL